MCQVLRCRHGVCLQYCIHDLASDERDNLHLSLSVAVYTCLCTDVTVIVRIDVDVLWEAANRLSVICTPDRLTWVWGP